MTFTFQPGDAILIVDAQNDFFPGGSLGVPGGDKIIPVLNEMIKEAKQKNLPIIASRDWHPIDHCSFKEFGGPWPVHCVQNTEGAAFHVEVDIPEDAFIINKAVDKHHESYSAFEGHTPKGRSLTELLNDLGITRVWIGGLALDYCVKASVLDGTKENFDIKVVMDATRAIDTELQHLVLDEISQAGAELI